MSVSDKTQDVRDQLWCNSQLFEDAGAKNCLYQIPQSILRSLCVYVGQLSYNTKDKQHIRQRWSSLSSWYSIWQQRVVAYYFLQADNFRSFAWGEIYSSWPLLGSHEFTINYIYEKFLDQKQYSSRFPNECSKCQWFYLGKKVFDLQLTKAFKLGTFLLFFSILLSL